MSLKVFTGNPSAVFQRITEPSSLALARIFPSGLQAMLEMLSLCSLRLRKMPPVADSQTWGTRG